MSDRSDARRLDVRLEAAPVEGPARPASGTPFQVVLLGDFTARASRRGVALRDPADRRPLLVDRDNLEDVLGRLGPELHVRTGTAGAPMVIKPRSLDDFHPDRLFEGLPRLAPFRELRGRLADPRTAPAAVRELLGGAAEPPGGAGSPPRARSGGGLLDEILAASGEPANEPLPPAPPPMEDELARFVRAVSAPHLLPQADARQAEVLARLDGTVSEALRAVLHDPGFQSLEALWRGLLLLVRRIETGGELKLFLLDVTKQELAADLAGAPALEDSGIYRLLVEETVGTPGATPWALILGCYAFGPEAEDLALLRRLGGVARAAGAPFLAAADARLSGWPSFPEALAAGSWAPPAAPAWEQLRTAPEARWLGLVAPRFLVREPYGASMEPCELLPFEELDPEPQHESFLWGNPALLAGLLLAETFEQEGWGLRPGVRAEVDGLPLCTLPGDDGSTPVPCAEALLTERMAERMMESGIMPLASLKDQNVVRLLRFQSIAAPVAALGGRWRPGPA